MEYPKINSLWKRDENKKLIVGDYSCKEFESIKLWKVSEKIDGTNIRLCFKRVDGQDTIPFIGGRTEAASIPTLLLNHLQTVFTWETFYKAFIELAESDNFEVWLFGEGYGPKIQNGGVYRDTPGFILFDVVVGTWWLESNDVSDIAQKLGIPVVPDIGISRTQDIIDFVKEEPFSRCSKHPVVIEGIVARSYPLMLFRNRLPIMWKLKVKDFNCQLKEKRNEKILIVRR